MARRSSLVPAALAVLALGQAGCSAIQRQLLYYPTHRPGANGLGEWRRQGKLIGYVRMTPQPRNVWLMLHGNAGQASDRAYAIPSFAPDDTVYIMEYPGYGAREGVPSRAAFDTAARDAYETLRAAYPHVPVCVAGESIGTGPASYLATLPHPPDKLVLITPFDVLQRVASEHFPRIAVALLLRDNWNNLEALKSYSGRVEIVGAKSDTVIPIIHARTLADAKSGAVFDEIEGGHNDWSRAGVKIRNP
jgi:pimeloyl-ACP methyl ester carboxylesterase